MQKDQIEQIKSNLGSDVLAWVPEFERDITGLPMIKRVADAMFGD
jgi:arsenite-transporting ATPase